MPLAGSYSRLAALDTCPRKLNLVSLKKLVKEPQSDVLDRGSEVHATLAHAVADPHATMPAGFPLAAQHIARLRGAGYELYPEREYAIDATRRQVDWFSPNAFYRFKLDVLAVNDSRGEVLDWKTGKVRVDQNQLRDYAIAAFLMLPQIEQVTARLVFLDQGQSMDSVYPRTALEPLYDALLARMQRLHAQEIAGEWPATPGPYCRWCPVPLRLCEHSQVPEAVP